MQITTHVITDKKQREKIDRQTYRQTGRQTDRQKDRQTDKQRQREEAKGIEIRERLNNMNPNNWLICKLDSLLNCRVVRLII